MYCKHCGKQIADDSKFCRYCGKGQDEIISEPNPQSNINAPTAETPIEKPTSESVIDDSSNNQSSNKLVNVFLWSVAICAVCTILYAIIFKEHSLPYDEAHYWGSSIYDTTHSLIGDDYGDQLTWMRKEGYENGIKNTAIYSFFISFAVLVIGSLLNKKK